MILTPRFRPTARQCALDAAHKSNGAMWFVPGSHLEALLPHHPASEGSHILQTDDVTESTPNARPIPLAPGDCVAWHGRTAHYSRGNSSPHGRRSFIVNFRPEGMVAWERAHGFDHLRRGFADYRNQMAAAGDVYKEAAPADASGSVAAAVGGVPIEEGGSSCEGGPYG